jgi:hypothetical protein
MIVRPSASDRNPLSSWRRSGRKLPVTPPPGGLTQFRIDGMSMALP